MKKLILLLPIILLAGCATTKTPVTLFTAILDSDTSAVVRLLDKWANIEERDIYGRTPLFYATNYSTSWMVELLLQRGANVNAQSDRWDTALMAVNPPPIDTVRILLDHGVDVNIKGYLWNTALMEYVYDPEVIKMLIDHGADVNAKNQSLETALMKSTMKETVQVLLDNWADVNAMNSNGYTALMYALNKKDQKEIVDMLIKKWADVNARNKFWKTALMLVTEDWTTEIADMLRQAWAIE